MLQAACTIHLMDHQGLQEHSSHYNRNRTAPLKFLQALCFNLETNGITTHRLPLFPDDFFSAAVTRFSDINVDLNGYE